MAKLLGIKVNKETGEIKNIMETSHGDKIISQEQSYAYSKIVEEKKYRSGQPSFIFTIYESCKPYLRNKELNSQDISRLIMLASYTGYNNKLMITERTPMTKKDMKDIVRIKKQETFNKFHNKLIKLSIIKKAVNEYFVNNDYFIKGEFDSNDMSFTRLYCDEVRHLFNSVNIRAIGRLGNIFAMIPYVNFKYNIVCHNPKEKDYSKIDVMSAKEFVHILGLDTSHTRRIFKDLISIKTINDESLLGLFLSDEIDIKESSIIMNPSAIYASKLACDARNELTILFKRKSRKSIH